MKLSMQINQQNTFEALKISLEIQVKYEYIVALLAKR
jgi:hypothetical protein